MDNSKINKTLYYLTVCISVIFVFSSCNKNTLKPKVSFYYWRTVFNLNQTEKQILKNNNVEKIYVRYFDVDLNGKNIPFPESPVFFQQKPDNIDIVPVVYIKNKVMLQKNINLDSLAKNIHNYIGQINKVRELKYNEIQVDCDWTMQSRDNFMKFIDILKRESGKKLSATIRLHQVKYFLQTKVPSVDKAVLMYYNMGKIAPDSLNSIYDRAIAQKYLTSLKKYPLKLDIALPIYSWGVHMRDNKVINLISKIDKTSFDADTNFIVHENSNIIITKNSNIKLGTYYIKDDKVKIEQVSEKEIKQMVKDIKSQLNYTPQQIIFYDLDSINLNKYKHEKRFFKKITSRF